MLGTLGIRERFLSRRVRTGAGVCFDRLTCNCVARPDSISWWLGADGSPLPSKCNFRYVLRHELGPFDTKVVQPFLCAIRYYQKESCAFLV